MTYCHLVEPHEKEIAELPAPSWVERHTWPLVLGFCAGCWCVVAYLVVG